MGLLWQVVKTIITKKGEHFEKPYQLSFTQRPIR